MDIVSALLDAGAKLEHRLPGGVTVLMLASALGLPDIVARLLTAGADVHAGDAQQLGPLHCAALYGFSARDRSRLLALLDTLLLAGAEPDQAAAGSVTPLLLLLGARAEPGTACDEQVVMAAVERLLDEDVSPTCVIRAASARCIWPRCMACRCWCSACCARGGSGSTRQPQPQPARDRRDARLHRRGR